MPKQFTDEEIIANAVKRHAEQPALFKTLSVVEFIVHAKLAKEESKALFTFNIKETKLLENDPKAKAFLKSAAEMYRLTESIIATEGRLDLIKNLNISLH